MHISCFGSSKEINVSVNLGSQEWINNLIPHIIHMGRTLLSGSINLVLNTLCIYYQGVLKLF